MGNRFHVIISRRGVCLSLCYLVCRQRALAQFSGNKIENRNVTWGNHWATLPQAFQRCRLVCFHTHQQKEGKKIFKMIILLLNQCFVGPQEHLVVFTGDHTVANFLNYYKATIPLRVRYCCHIWSDAFAMHVKNVGKIHKSNFRPFTNITALSSAIHLQNLLGHVASCYLLSALDFNMSHEY